MDSEDNDAMNGDDAWNGIRGEGGHPVPQESGKYITPPKEGGARTQGRK